LELRNYLIKTIVVLDLNIEF